MMLLRAFDILLLLVTTSCVVVGQDVGQRNVLHFVLKDNWVGRPAAFMKTVSGSMALFYETPRFRALTADSRTVLNLGLATSEDEGMTWQVQSDFLDGTKLSLGNNTSITRGGVLMRPNGNATKRYVVAYGIRDKSMTGETKIHVVFAGDNLVVDPKKKGYEAKGITPYLFEFEGEIYVAYLTSSYNCIVQVAKAEVNGGVVREIDLKLQGKCLSPQLFKLNDNKFALFISHQKNPGSPYKSLYSIELAEADRTLEFGDTTSFYAGHDAQYFSFSRIGNEIVAIGWNGHASKDGNSSIGGLTLPRKVSFDSSLNVLKQDPWIRIDPSTSGEWWNRTLTKDEHAGKNLTAIVKQGAVLFELDFEDQQNPQMLGAASITVQFQQRSGNDTGNLLSVVMTVTPDVKNDRFCLLIVNRTGIEVPSGAPAVAFSTRSVPSAKGKLKIVLDRSTIDVYGEDGYFALTESYRLEDEVPLSHVSIKADANLTVKAKITAVRSVVKEKVTATSPITGQFKEGASQKTNGSRNFSRTLSILMAAILPLCFTIEWIARRY